MNRSKQKLARLASMIHGDLLQAQHQHVLRAFPHQQCDRARELSRRLGQAQARGWHNATNTLLQDYQSAIAQLEYELQRLRTDIAGRLTPRPVATTGEIYRDLAVLQDEFSAMSWDAKGRTLTVETEAIELEGWYLGPFEIELQWRKIGRPQPYRVIAVDPHPASGSDAVTHPHVQDESVCEGEATVPIQRALTSGRLYDFFSIVNQLLHTYNDSSPFIPLSRWDGAVCHDCDATVYDDEGYTCEACTHLVCDECCRRCNDCGDSHCSECLSVCPGCQEDYCSSCTRTCSSCDASYCSDCLDDNERCPTCHDEHENEQDPARPETDPALHADGVGEAAAVA